MLEMQLSQLWHGIIALIFIAIIIGHIYIGTIGMEGAFDAMSSGEVDLNWAKEHHALWVDELRAGGKSQSHAPPAEQGRPDRKAVVSGTRVSVRVGIGGRRTFTK